MTPRRCVAAPLPSAAGAGWVTRPMRTRRRGWCGRPCRSGRTRGGARRRASRREQLGREERVGLEVAQDGGRGDEAVGQARWVAGFEAAEELGHLRAELGRRRCPAREVPQVGGVGRRIGDGAPPPAAPLAGDRRARRVTDPGGGCRAGPMRPRAARPGAARRARRGGRPDRPPTARCRPPPSPAPRCRPTSGSRRAGWRSGGPGGRRVVRRGGSRRALRRPRRS